MGQLSKYFIENENIGIYEQIFENVEIIDSHAHLGVDKDGHKINTAGLLAEMKKNAINKAIVFPLNDPLAGEDFNVPNEKIFEAYKQHPEALIPFFRVNPNTDWNKEFELRKSQGFLGVKLHPRSQEFHMTSPKAMKLYEKIEASGLIVLIHSGFGLDSVAEDLGKIAKTFPTLKLLIGHGGFPELDEVMKQVKDRDNVYFEASTMRIFDLVELIKTVGCKKIVFGSDIPIYDQTLALQMLIDSATVARQTPNQIRQMLGENIKKWLKQASTKAS